MLVCKDKENTIKVREYNKIKISCDCGAFYSRGGQSRHEKSKRHKKFISLTSGGHGIS
tara:strand:- start:1714 stop:1887 length:174 start_codon:yes stop_codon:yes gene_type:complete